MYLDSIKQQAAENKDAMWLFSRLCRTLQGPVSCLKFLSFASIPLKRMLA
jgi:hypothetical protein